MHILLGEHPAEFHLLFFSFFSLKAENGSLSRLEVQSEMPEAAVMIVGVSGWNSPNEKIISEQAAHVSPALSEHERGQLIAHLPVYRRPSPSVSSPSEKRHHTTQYTCYR